LACGVEAARAPSAGYASTGIRYADDRAAHADPAIKGYASTGTCCTYAAGRQRALVDSTRTCAQVERQLSGMHELSRYDGNSGRQLHHGR
jgi:hypothetical protein